MSKISSFTLHNLGSIRCRQYSHIFTQCHLQTVFPNLRERRAQEESVVYGASIRTSSEFATLCGARQGEAQGCGELQSCALPPPVDCGRVVPGQKCSMSFPPPLIFTYSNAKKRDTVDKVSTTKGTEWKFGLTLVYCE